MSEAIYHINPETGRPNRCYAQIKCRYGAESPHFNSKEEAREAFEKEQKQEEIPAVLKKAIAGTTKQEHIDLLTSPNVVNALKEAEEKKRLAEERRRAEEATEDQELQPMRRNVYEFRSESLPEALAKIDTANKKLEKYGIEQRFEYEVEEYTTKQGHLPGTIIQLEESMTRLKITTPVIAKNGYKFLAQVGVADAGFVIRTAKGVELNGWKPESQYCEHCSSDRQRNVTYLVENEEGERKQIGSSCIKAYTGVSVSGLWSVGQDLDLSDISRNSENMGTRTPKKMATKDILAYALAVSSGGEKFVSRSVASRYDKVSTAEDLNFVLYANPKDYEMKKMQREMTAKAKEYLENGKAEEVLEMIRNVKVENDYTSNLSTIAKGENVTDRDIGLLISGLTILRKKKEAEERASKPKPAPGFAGDVKSSVKGMKATVSNVYHREVYDEYKHEYVVKSIVKFRDEQGHEMVWFASKEIENLEEGQKITFAGGSVKSHGSYDGYDQTGLTRVKVAIDED